MKANTIDVVESAIRNAVLQASQPSVVNAVFSERNKMRAEIVTNALEAIRSAEGGE